AGRPVVHEDLVVPGGARREAPVVIRRRACADGSDGRGPGRVAHAVATRGDIGDGTPRLLEHQHVGTGRPVDVDLVALGVGDGPAHVGDRTADGAPKLQRHDAPTLRCPLRQGIGDGAPPSGGVVEGDLTRTTRTTEVV